MKRGRKGPRPQVCFKIKPEVLDMLRQGAEYHQVPYQTYLNWLIEEGVKQEAAYYGWQVQKPIYTVKGATKTQKKEVERLLNQAIRSQDDEE